jgi:hypothetical protein
LPCLEFVPRSERWAELLVGIAIVEYSQQGDWKAPLATALHIHPGVARLVGPLHEMYAWEPPAAPQMTEQTIPEGVRIYLDGELLTRVSQTPGLHLAQRRTGDGWTTLLMRDGEIPSGWFDEPSLLARSGVDKRLGVGLLAGLGLLSQAVDDSGDFLADASQTRPAFGLGLNAGIGLVGSVGFYADAAIPDVLGFRGIGAHGGLGWGLGPVELQAGGGVQRVSAVAGAEMVSAWLPFPTLGARLTAADALDLGAHVGLSPALSRAQLVGGWTLEPGLRVGADVRYVAAPWVQAGPERRVHANELLASLSVGWLMGQR